MKKISSILLGALIIAFMTASCSTKEKALTANEKALQAQIDSLKAVESMRALASRTFAVNFDRLTMRHGGTFTVHPTINFVYINGDQGAIQIASPATAPGPNGIGGITLKGTVRNFEMNTDKKGNATATFMLSGYGMSASVRLKLPKGDTYATVDISPNYGNGAMTATGPLGYYSPDNVVRGYPDM